MFDYPITRGQPYLISNKGALLGILYGIQQHGIATKPAGWAWANGFENKPAGFGIVYSMSLWIMREILY